MKLEIDDDNLIVMLGIIAIAAMMMHGCHETEKSRREIAPPAQATAP